MLLLWSHEEASITKDGGRAAFIGRRVLDETAADSINIVRGSIKSFMEASPRQLATLAVSLRLHRPCLEILQWQVVFQDITSFKSIFDKECVPNNVVGNIILDDQIVNCVQRIAAIPRMVHCVPTDI